MGEIRYALISKLGESYQHNPACADVVMYSGEYHRILQISQEKKDLIEMLNISPIQKLFIGKVRKILDAENGEAQWEIIKDI